MTRRDALTSGLAAVFGLPLAKTLETNMVALPPPRKVSEPDDSYDHFDDAAETTCPLTPCQPKNDARVERLAILLHVFCADCSRLCEEHGDDCECHDCNTVKGSAWVMEVLQSCFDSGLVGWTHFFDADDRGAAKDVADAARRLDLPLSLVQEYVAWDCPVPLVDRINEAMAKMKAETATA